ncbi:hypothetical protein ON010_g3833 [Phytophthora cinnamomi]|nr:hypothetical protein ON010_g3833 [Phytophthora cinnamomi]
MPPPKKLDDNARELAKQRVLRVFREGGDWKLAAIHNDLPYTTARRAVVDNGTDPKQRGGVRWSCVKMTVEVMAKLEEYLDEDRSATLIDVRQTAERHRGFCEQVVGSPCIIRHAVHNEEATHREGYNEQYDQQAEEEGVRGEG